MKNKIRRLNTKSTFSTLAITCYPDHLPKGEKDLFKNIKHINPSDFQITAIKHDKSESAHYHIIIRIPDSKKRAKVSSMLKKLGIVFRPGIDDGFIKDRALETCGFYSEYVTYLLHKTTTAIQEGKVPYERSDYITNMSSGDLTAILNGYSPTKRQLTKKGLANIIDQARAAGYELKQYDSLIESFNILGFTPTEEAKVKKAYISGVTERMNKNSRINRLTLEIEYPHNATAGLKKQIDDALCAAMAEYHCCITNYKPLVVDPFTEAILYLSAFSDWHHDYDNLSTRSIVELSKPLTNGKTIWCGKVFIFTHSFISKEKPYYQENDKAKTPLDSYKTNSDSLLCIVENNELKCIRQPDQEFSEEEYSYIINTYKRIRDNFNEAMKQNSQLSNTKKIDLDELNS